MPWLALLAANTSKITMGTSILNVFSRTPAAIAQEFSTIDVISGGRMMLGLGSSGAFVIEHFHGVPFDRPLRRLREYVEIFNMLIAGEKLDYEGQIFQMSRGFRIDYDRPRTHVPVFVAAITPKSIRQTGEIADGILPIHWPKRSSRRSARQLAEGARGCRSRLGRDHDRAADRIVFVTDGQNDDEQWAAARQPLAALHQPHGRLLLADALAQRLRGRGRGLEARRGRSAISRARSTRSPRTWCARSR